MHCRTEHGRTASFYDLEQDLITSKRIVSLHSIQHQPVISKTAPKPSVPMHFLCNPDVGVDIGSR